jgi:hypothetical protein
MEVSPANYRDWKSASTVFESMGAYNPTELNLVGDGDPDRLEAAAVTADVLPMLRVAPTLGRLFAAADDREGAPGTVLLSHGLWQSRFGGEAGVLGRRVLLDGTPHVVIGVMPRGFYFPSRGIALWRPLAFRADAFEDRDDNYLKLVAKLRPGVSLEAARAEMAVVAGRLEREYPKENEQTDATVNRLRDELPEQLRLLLLALCGAALCILLIACWPVWEFTGCCRIRYRIGRGSWVSAWRWARIDGTSWRSCWGRGFAWRPPAWRSAWCWLKAPRARCRRCSRA